MSSVSDFVSGNDGPLRCWWCGDDPEYVRYHDREWGLPVADDRRLFEKICLEGFQSGLSWITILRKREAFRQAFDGFDFHRVARYRKARIDRLVTNAKIIRHRGKIESVVNNARRALELLDEQGSLASFFWQFEPSRATPRRRKDQIESKTEESVAMSKELKRRGWTFVGPTTCYAMMQSIGIVNDHLRDCHVWSDCDQARATFTRPR
jgi:DNA-3-methyladenine glycosylase I